MKSILTLLLLSLFMGCDAIFEKDLIGEHVVVVSPVDGAIADSGRITFLWRKVEGADGYRVIVVSPSFESASRVALDTIVDSLTRCDVVLIQGDYEWSIEGFNSASRTLSRVLNLKIE